MKKFDFMSGTLTGLFAGVFNVAFFAGVSNFTATRWVCWVFIHLAYALLAATICTVPNVRGGLTFGYSRILVAGACFLAEFALGILFIALNPAGVVFPLVLQLAVVAAFLYVYLALLRADKHTIAVDTADQRDLHFMRDCAARLQTAAKTTDDPDIRRQIEKALAALRNAQVVSCPAAADMETELLALADALNAAVFEKRHDAIPDTLKRVHALILQRDNAIRLAQR